MDFRQEILSHQNERKNNILKGFQSQEMPDEIIKGGKAAFIGEIREWSGKRYKKQANGKWLEVSEHGMTKKEHNDKRIDALNRASNSDSEGVYETYHGSAKKHEESSSKLSDKEHSDKEVGVYKVHLEGEDEELTPLEIGDKLILTEKSKKSKEESLSGIQKVKDDAFEFIGMVGGALRVKDSKGGTYILSSTRFKAK